MKEANKDTIRVSTLPAKYQKKLADRYGEVHPQDFLSGDKKTYFKFDGENKATGSVTHRPINMPSFESMYLIYSKLVGSVKYLAKNQEIADDTDARQLFDTIKTTYRQLQTYLRNERPEQYELMKMRRVMEEKTYKEIIEVLAEEKPGLWANIRAKKARGAKPAHKNSNAHKDAVKAGKKINSEASFAADKNVSRGYIYARDTIAYLREKVYRKLNDKELEEFRREMYEHYKDAVAEDTTKESQLAEKRAHRILSPKDQAANDAKFDKRMSTLKDLEKGQRLHKAGKISDKDLYNLKVKAGVVSAVKKESLWANINAKKKAGKKSSHGNSNAHKDAVKAGNKLKETEHQGSNYKWPMSKATKDRKEADVAAQKAKRKAGNKLK